MFNLIIDVLKNIYNDNKCKKYCIICKIFTTYNIFNTRCKFCKTVFIDLIVKKYNINKNNLCLTNFSNKCNICLENNRTIINYPCLCITNCNTCILDKCVICYKNIENNLSIK